MHIGRALVIAYLLWIAHPSRAEACYTPPSGVWIDRIQPQNGGPGTEIRIEGQGFDQIPSDTFVYFFTGSFGGAQAQILDRSEFTIRAIVPQGARDGQVSLAVNRSCTTVGGGQGGGVFIVAESPHEFVTEDYPAQPSLRSATAIASDRIALSWRDNSDDEEGFRIYLLRAGDKYIHLGDLGPNETTVEVEQLLPDTLYYFNVTAFKGERETITAVEDLASTRTLPPPVGIGSLGVQPGFVSTLCPGTFQLTQIAAFFDADADGVVRGFEDGLYNGQRVTGTFPRFPVPDIWAPNGYALVNGARYAVNTDGVLANLVIVGVVPTCGGFAQFVALHLAVYQEGDQVKADPVILMAGDLFDFYQRDGVEIRGVVMEGPADVPIDTGEIKNRLARGSASGRLFWLSPDAIPYEAQITFEFEVPIEDR